MPDAENPLSTPQPWDRLPDESAKAHGAFVLYRSLPSMGRYVRSAYVLYLKEQGRDQSDIIGAKPHPAFRKWSKDYQWEERAAAWDQHQLGLELDAVKEQRSRIRIAAHDGILTGIRKQNGRIDELSPYNLSFWISTLVGLLKYMDEAGASSSDGTQEVSYSDPWMEAEPQPSEAVDA